MSIVKKTSPSGKPLLIRGGGIITMDKKLGDFAQADLLIEEGIIKKIAPTINVTDAEIIDASSMIVMPGFIDGHRHQWEGNIRGALPTEDLDDYFKIVNQGFAPAYTPNDVYLGTLVSSLGALDAGITTVFDWSHIQTTRDHTDATIAALRESGLRVVFGFGMPGREDPENQWPQDLIRLKKEEFASDDQLVTLALASLSPEHVPYEMAKAHFEMVRDAGVIISVHSGLAGMGEPDQIERFGKEGLLGPHVNLVHCNTLSETEWKIIADTGTSVCITPSTEMQMGQGIPPIQQALDAGVKPSLGIDVETTVPGDMWTQMRVLYALQRQNAFTELHAGREAPKMIDVNDILEYATTAGATATGLEKKVGTIAEGKQADIILLSADTLNVMPVNDMRNAVALNMDSRNVDTVIVGGNIVKRHGKMIGVNIKDLSKRLDQSRNRLFDETGLPGRSIERSF